MRNKTARAQLSLRSFPLTHECASAFWLYLAPAAPFQYAALAVRLEQAAPHIPNPTEIDCKCIHNCEFARERAITFAVSMVWPADAFWKSICRNVNAIGMRIAATNAAWFIVYLHFAFFALVTRQIGRHSFLKVVAPSARESLARKWINRKRIKRRCRYRRWSKTLHSSLLWWTVCLAVHGQIKSSTLIPLEEHSPKPNPSMTSQKNRSKKFLRAHERKTCCDLSHDTLASYKLIQNIQ